MAGGFVYRQKFHILQPQTSTVGPSPSYCVPYNYGTMYGTIVGYMYGTCTALVPVPVPVLLPVTVTVQEPVLEYGTSTSRDYIMCILYIPPVQVHYKYPPSYV